MDLHETAQGYLSAIEIVDKKIEELKEEQNTTRNLETKRKIADKLNSLRHVKREMQFTYAYLINYDNKNAKVAGWI